MPLKNIAVQGCTLNEPTASITTPPSTKVKADGKPVYRGTLTISITGYTGQGISGGAGVGTLTGSAQKIKIESQPAVLEGDQATISVTGATPAGPPATVPVTVSIQNAGQDKAKGI